MDQNHTDPNPGLTTGTFGPGNDPNHKPMPHKHVQIAVLALKFLVLVAAVLVGLWFQNRHSKTANVATNSAAASQSDDLEGSYTYEASVSLENSNMNPSV